MLIPDFTAELASRGLDVAPGPVSTLWLNITSLCNQRCAHCHVAASPYRTEQMPRKVMDRCLQFLADHPVQTLDITGGAPELHPDFGYLVKEARKLGKRVRVRHNLTVTLDAHPLTGKSLDGLPEFFAENQVEILASLPGWQAVPVDKIRGAGVFAQSLQSARLLNAVGYGRADSGLCLSLVCNRDGPVTPGERLALEEIFRRELMSRYGLKFNDLLTVTNLPINRYRRQLQRFGKLERYMRDLAEAFSPKSAESLVCRSVLSVNWQGRLFDCDFNQMLGLQIQQESPATIFNVDYTSLPRRRLRFAAHCFGCTAGGGSN